MREPDERERERDGERGTGDVVIDGALLDVMERYKLVLHVWDAWVSSAGSIATCSDDNGCVQSTQPHDVDVSSRFNLHWPFEFRDLR